jgi:hypothetical protein
MSIFNAGNFAKPFNVSQPHLNSSDRTAHLKSKTKYAAAVNLAQNGGTLAKADGSKYVGTVQTTSSAVTSASSYDELLDVTKGKYLLAPPPSSNLTAAFSPANGDVYYGNFTVTDYAEAHLPVTALGYPTVTANSPPAANYYVYPNQLVATTNPTPVTPVGFNVANIVVDPEYRMFYSQGTCSTRNYFKNVRVDPSIDVHWTTTSGFGSEVVSSRPYNEQQAQRIIAHQAQSLRGFQYPARVHLDLENCESKPSITPVAPDAPVIYMSGRDGDTVTISWLHGFDGGSPISTSPSPSSNPIWGYTIYTSTDGLIASIAPQPCFNSYTFTVTPPTEIWVTASNCVPKETWPSGVFQIIKCTTLTSGPSNHLVI